jgi:aspartyl-tRNA synthetase
MERTYISELKDLIGKSVRIRGRVDTIRDQGKIAFLIVRDRTGKVQSVAIQNENNTILKTVKELTNESVVDIIGDVKEAKQVAAGYEVEIKEIKVDSLSQAPLPIVIEQPYSKNISNLDKRLDYRWIDLRSERNNLMMRVATRWKSIKRVLSNNHFIEIQLLE